jgi:hypothetical protein
MIPPKELSLMESSFLSIGSVGRGGGKTGGGGLVTTIEGNRITRAVFMSISSTGVDMLPGIDGALSIHER